MPDATGPWRGSASTLSEPPAIASLEILLDLRLDVRPRRSSPQRIAVDAGKRKVSSLGEM
jgi:hypothetical protein